MLVRARKQNTDSEGDTPTAGTDQGHMLAAGDNQEFAEQTLAVVGHTVAAYMAHLQGDNHPETDSATEDWLDSWNRVSDRSSTGSSLNNHCTFK